MTTITILGFAILGGILFNRRRSIVNQIPDEKDAVRDAFESPHDRFTKGSEDLRIDGGGTFQGFSAGAPVEGNSVASLFMYPNSKASSQINKDFSNWEKVGVIDKEKQLQLLNEKLNMEEHPLLDFRYKQLNGRTVSAQPKINLKPGYFLE